MIAPLPGDCFYFDPDRQANVHLWVVLTVYASDHIDDSLAIIVSITSMKPGADRACVLRSDDGDAHGFVKHESYAYYERCREVEAVELLRRREDRRSPVAPTLLARLRDGLHKSPFAPRWAKSRVPRQ